MVSCLDSFWANNPAMLINRKSWWVGEKTPIREELQQDMFVGDSTLECPVSCELANMGLALEENCP